jgi:hypothetical protein
MSGFLPSIEKSNGGSQLIDNSCAELVEVDERLSSRDRLRDEGVQEIEDFQQLQQALIFNERKLNETKTFFFKQAGLDTYGLNPYMFKLPPVNRAIKVEPVGP